MHWYACHCQAQKESLAARELRREGFEVFFPYTIELVKAGHKSACRPVRRPWLSRYLFVLAQQDDLHLVNETAGVSTVVRAPGGEPHPVPQVVMDSLLAQADDWGEIYITKAATRRRKYKSGQVIRLLDEKSPLFGLYVEVKKALDNGNICGTLVQNAIAGTTEVTIEAPVIGEIVEGAA
jgi:transcriptional antiterminator RfaH